MKLILCVESAASSRTPGNREILAIVSLVLYLIEFRMFFTRTYEIYACGTFAPKGIKARKRNKRPRDSDIRSQSACFLYMKSKGRPTLSPLSRFPFLQTNQHQPPPQLKPAIKTSAIIRLLRLYRRKNPTP